MVTIDTVKIEDVVYRWKDDDTDDVYGGKIVVATQEELDYIFNQLEEGDPTWSDFDHNILFYLNSDDENIEDLYDPEFPSEFLLVRD